MPARLATWLVGAWAALASAGCLWPEPVNEEVIGLYSPINVDVSSVNGQLDTTQEDAGGDCLIDLTMPRLIIDSPTAQPLWASFYLNYNSVNFFPAPLLIDGRTTFPLTAAGESTDYVLDSPKKIALNLFGANLLPKGAPGNNLLSVFVVTGGFAENTKGIPEPIAGGYIASYTWEVVFAICDPLNTSAPAP